MTAMSHLCFRRFSPAGALVTSSENGGNCAAISAGDAVRVRTRVPHETSRGWVLVQTDDGAAPSVADALTELAGVTVERTVGAYDIVAHVDDRSVVGAERVVRTAAALPGVLLAVCCRAPAASAPTASAHASTPQRRGRAYDESHPSTASRKHSRTLRA